MTNTADEVLEYLQFLVRHGRWCRSTSCRQCQTLHSICALMTSLLFSTDFCRQEEGPVVSQSAAKSA